MKKSHLINHRHLRTISLVMATVLSLTACTGAGTGSTANNPGSSADAANPDNTDSQASSGLSLEKIEDTAQSPDGEKVIDFEALKQENSEIFAWINIPGTDVDQPILQSLSDDDQYYATHDEHRQESATGAAYTEYPNRTDFCDFNEVIYGVDRESVLSYRNPDFFEENKNIEIYIDGNHMTYEVCLAREWNRENFLMQYDFTLTYECDRFLNGIINDLTLADNMTSRILEDNYGYYLITLVAYEENKPDKQFIVVARLVNDRNGTINYPSNGLPGLEDGE